MNVGSKRGRINFANKCIADALLDMGLWIGRGNWKIGFGNIFFDLRDLMAKDELRLTVQIVRQTSLHNNTTLRVRIDSF